ncbi:MAG TPA: thioredoxin domain-containing protein [Acidobacteriaceae bacterium]|nr:thioredoxin domain-containing protein [Acidobacteriaceae bacterium]
MKRYLAALLCVVSAAAAHAQNTPAGIAGNNGAPFQNVSELKLPAGAKAAVFEFEDMECPACARTFPIVHAAVAHYKIPLIRHDFPWSFHEWSMNAAVTARFIQDQISPQLADTFRRDLFANQNRIESKDELARFTREWFASHHENLPFVMDASGRCRNEVQSDKALGDHLNVQATPCVIVVTRSSWVSVPYANIAELDHIVGQAIDEAHAPAMTTRRSQGVRP